MSRGLCLAFLVFASACASAPPESATTEEDLWGIGENPQDWRAFWRAKYAGRLAVQIEPAEELAPYDGPKTVLLIPGTTIGPEFFAPMKARLERDGFDPVIWAPPDLFTESLWIGAARIDQEVKSLLAERNETRLHIVAECDGGVAARYYSEILDRGEHVDQLVTFVSAHHGSQGAPLGGWFTHWPALNDIRPGSEIMQKINSRSMPDGTKLTSIYTCHDEFLWPYTTSRVPDATNVEFCGTWIGHFDGFWNATVYQRILVTLRGEGDSAPTWY